MAIMGKDGLWSGKFGDIVYYRVKDSREQHFRRMPEKYNDPSTYSQRVIRDVVRGQDENILCVIVNAKLTGQEPEKFIWYGNTQARLITSRTLAATCGWREQMLLLLEGPRPKPFERVMPEIIWADVADGKIRALVFAPAPGKDIWSRVVLVRMALRVWLRICYHSVGINRKIIAVFDMPTTQQAESSLAQLPDFYRQKAEAFLAERYKNYKSKFRDKTLKGARFAAFEIKDFPMPKHKFLRPRIRIADLSECNLHIEVDLAGMFEKKYGDNSFYCALKSRFSDEVAVRLPKKKLGGFGLKLVRHLKKVSKKHRDEYLSDPKTRAERNLRHRERLLESRREDPERADEVLRHRAELRRVRYNTDPAYRSHRLKYNNRWRKNNLNNS